MDKNEIKELIEIIRTAIQDLTAWPRWMPSRVASRYSGLSEKTLRKLAKEGEIYATKVGGKLIFDKKSIDQFMLREKAQLQNLLDGIQKTFLTS